MPFVVMQLIHMITVILTLCYVVLMLLYRAGWRLQDDFKLPEGFNASTKISIIIPARNEEENIAACLDSILMQDYPAALFEVIVVDDHSGDHTAAIVDSYNTHNVRCISLADSDSTVMAYKKKALATGISMATGTLIVTTDADCIASKQWLRNIAALYEKDTPPMIVAPVDFTTDGSLVQVFQSLDFMSMQGITAAAHRLKLGNMSNGANLAFTKDAYDKVDGYNGIDHLASGDDYLLMTKINAAYPGAIKYLKSGEAIVRTAPQLDWNSFLQQRIRWASKSGKYPDAKMTFILLLVYLFNLSFLAALIFGSFALFAGMLIAKIIAELFYLYPVAVFFKKTRQLIIFPLLQPLHISYIILAGFLGFVGVYRWKGRTVK